MKIFWTLLFFGGIIWYIYTIFCVGIKGFYDVKEMLLNINKNNNSKENKYEKKV